MFESQNKKLTSKSTTHIIILSTHLFLTWRDIAVGNRLTPLTVSKIDKSISKRITFGSTKLYEKETMPSAGHPQDAYVSTPFQPVRRLDSTGGLAQAEKVEFELSNESTLPIEAVI